MHLVAGYCRCKPVLCVPAKGGFGESKKGYADTVGSRFIVTHFSDWHGANPDLIGFDQVKNIDTEIRENREEIFYTDSDGNSKSYTPYL